MLQKKLFTAVWVILLSLVSLELSAAEREIIGFDYYPQQFENQISEGENLTESLFLTNTGDVELSYTINISENDCRSGSRDVSSAYLTCRCLDFNPGTEVSWIFDVYNFSADNEGLTDIYLFLPEQVGFIGADDFTGGSGGTLLFTEFWEDENVVYWHSDTAAIFNEETAFAAIDLEINAECWENIYLDYHIFGEYGNLVSGTIEVRTLCIGWCSISSSSGVLQPGESDTIELNFCAQQVPAGSYYGEIQIDIEDDDSYIVPLSVEVTATDVSSEVVIPGVKSLVNYPNPFNPVTEISFGLNKSETVSVFISDLKGRTVYKLWEGILAAGDHSFTWMGKDQQGKNMDSGIYLCCVQTRESKISTKLCLIK